MAELCLYLFGAPRLERNGKTVKIETWKAQALLAYLTLNGQEHHREALATLFWPEQGEVQARGSLRRALWTLRQALATAGLDGDKQTLIFRRPAALQVDVLQFQALLAASAAVENLRAAVTLYRNDFLAGFTLPDCPLFDEWQFFTAERLRRQLADALQQLIAWDTSQQNYPAAIAAAQRWLALDPLQEAAHRRLMQLYTWSGQLAAALRQYETCKRLLDDELGVPPEPETEELYTAIRANRLTAPAKPISASVETNNAPQPAAPPRYSLPRPVLPLFGRTLELAELDLLMVDRGERLLTITGPGGMGKTRLALAVAERHLAAQRFRDGACFVALAAIDDPQAIVPALVNALGLSAEGSQLPAEARKRQVLDFLADQQMLLIFDNFEQVLEGRTLLGEILTAAPAVHLLVTARERLHLYDEQVYPIGGLECPTTVSDTDAPALALFLRTVQRSQPRFQPNAQEQHELVRICQLVGGMPLALELAAAWAHLLPLATIADAIQTNLDLLEAQVADLPARQRSMRATFATTWQLLADEERVAFAQLSVFRGGFTRDAAHQVAGVSLKQLNALMDKSLLAYRRTVDRYVIHELLRQYGAEQLVSQGEAPHVQRRHAYYFLALVESANLELRGPRQKEQLDRIESELDNLRAALAVTLSQEPPLALALAAALGPFWRRRYGSEGYQWVTAALAADPKLSPLRAKALMFGGALARLNGERAQARSWLQESVAFWRTTDDLDYLAQALRYLGWAYYSVVPSQSIAYIEESLQLFRQLGNEQRIAQCLTDLSHLTRDATADYVQATRYGNESLTFMRKFGDQLGIAHALLALAELTHLQGQYAEAIPLLTEAMAIFQLLNNKGGLADTLVAFIENAWQRGAYQEACTWGERVLHEVGEQHTDARLLWHHLGLVDVSLGHPTQAQERLQKSLRLAYEPPNEKMIARCLAGLGGVALSQGDALRAVRLLSAAYAQFAQLPPFLAPADEAAYQSWITQARTAVGEARFADEWVYGETMALDAIVREALR
ncbi:MAG: hypothetical protein DYG89_50800 [Caldilinea sp. CFX5]|nr:hypothetical protein [Caldilinea sp. CFX5]